MSTVPLMRATTVELRWCRIDKLIEEEPGCNVPR